MLRIAITGSYASGKSFILNLIAQMGYPIFTCDDYVRGLYEDLNMQNQVIKAIPGLDKFDKKRLSEIIFSDEKARKTLEALIHPKVLEGINEFVGKNKTAKLIFFEVPLLFETDFDKYFDKTITVYCDEKLRLSRARTRHNFNEDLFNKIASIQYSQDKKKQLADCTINSEQPENKLKQEIREIIFLIM